MHAVSPPLVLQAGNDGQHVSHMLANTKQEFKARLEQLPPFGSACAVEVEEHRGEKEGRGIVNNSGSTRALDTEGVGEPARGAPQALTAGNTSNEATGLLRVECIHVV